MTDPIADMLARIRNALAARHKSVKVSYSKIKEAILKILKAQHYIADFRVEGEKSGFKVIVIDLNSDGEESAITNLVRVSKPGRRVYSSSRDIQPVLSGKGIVIVSTSNGVMTGREARNKGLGGEVICKVW
jgi:small subunit ribosomal protein S8